MFRSIQISDTHLSHAKPHFGDNWHPLARWIKERQPDLVVNTGDLTIDGADTDDDLTYCAAAMQDLGVPFRVVPGNHDVGDARHRHQPVNAARLARWQAQFGPDHWVIDVEGWRLIGIDAMLIGSGEAEEAAQLAWLEAAMAEAEAAGRRLAWFLHRPLFLEHPDEGDTGYWSVKPEPRRALLTLIRCFGVAVVASGHLHKAHRFEFGGTTYVWGPSSAFLCGPRTQIDMPGEKRLGAVEYVFEGAEVDIEISTVPGLAEHWIDPVIEEVYPLHLDSRPPRLSAK